jgi:hypothetical protein
MKRNRQLVRRRAAKMWLAGRSSEFPRLPQPEPSRLSRIAPQNAQLNLRLRKHRLDRLRETFSLSMQAMNTSFTLRLCSSMSTYSQNFAPPSAEVHSPSFVPILDDADSHERRTALHPAFVPHLYHQRHPETESDTVAPAAGSARL